MKCPHCDVALSLHRGGRLVCHYCGYEQPAVRICPECGSRYIAGFRAGTEQIEEALRKEYPKARILRMDADTTTGKGSFEKILSAFANEEADILLGTQMIVKGHDFPKVTLMGILLADLSLYSNDYRAAERTFQLLTQAAGRAGLYFEFNLSLWDYAAGALIAAEAGAVCLRPDGSPLPYTGEKSALVAAPRPVLDEFFALAGDMLV